MILSGAELLIIFIILILHLLVLVTIQARTTMITTIMISHLVTILFYSIIVADYQSLKELTIATIIYSTTILALISNSHHTFHTKEIKRPKIRIATLILSVAIFNIAIVSGIFYLTKNLGASTEKVRNAQIKRQNDVVKNPLIFPGHPAHINVKKYYLGKNFDNLAAEPDSTETSQLKELYSTHKKEKLRSNILFRRSSDAIIIIVGLMTAILLNYRYREE